MKRGWFALVLVVVLFFATGLVSAANCGGDIACSCGDVLTSSRVLNESDALLNCEGYGLIIAADNIILDCAGNSITKEQHWLGDGIYSEGQSNITIKNCTINNFNYGIRLFHVSEGNILNNNLTNNFQGLELISSSLLNVSNNFMKNNQYGIYVDAYVGDPSFSNTFFNNTAIYNYYSGFYSPQYSEDNNISGNTFCSNGEGDVYFGYGTSNNSGLNVFDNFYDTYESNSGLLQSSPCVFPEFVQGGCWQFVNSSLTLTEDITGCSNSGIKVYADNITIDCDGHSISGQGNYKGIINAGHNNVKIKNCIIHDFDYGFYLTYNGEDLAENSSIDNSTFYDNNYGAYGEYFLSLNVTNSSFETNEYGLYIEYSEGGLVLDSNFTENVNYGLYTYTSSDNNISFNNFNYNTHGVYLNSDSDNNSILDNNFTGNVYGFYLDNADNNQIGRNFVNSTQYNFGESSSCPFLYTWNGTGYTFVSDMSTEGKLSNAKLYPDDYLKVDGNQLQPVDNKYNLQVTEEYDEISFIDQLKLFTIDHSPDVDVFNGLTRADAHSIYTVSKNPSQVVSCLDSLGADCLSVISAKDGVFTMHPVDNITNMVTLNLGNLSNASEIKLIISYSWANGYLVPNYKKSVQLKDESGNWVSILSDSDLTTRAALQKTYVLNLTNRFFTNNYSVRLILPIQAIDYVAIDTTPQQEVTIKEYDPLTADLHYRGYSNFTTNITRMFFYDTLINNSFSTPSGNFTRYGDVLPLVNSTDDKYAIIGHGDEISASFAYEPIPEGKERDFLMFEYAYYKPASLDIGRQVDPLPFRAMSKYPYNETESYPLTQENQNYLSEYNTRQMRSAIYGGSLPSSINNTVFENTIISNFLGYGLYLDQEINTSILNNNISGEGLGIYLDSSTGTIVMGNNVSTQGQSIYIYDASTYNNITNNTLSCANNPVIYIEDGSSSNTILHNTIIGDQWIDDGDGNNYYNDSYSGNIYYFADGNSSWGFYNLTDSNDDGWADSGSDWGFNSSLHSWSISLQYQKSLSSISVAEGWTDSSMFQDDNGNTGSSPSGSFAYTVFNTGEMLNVINADFIVTTGISMEEFTYPEECWGNGIINVTAYTDSNITVFCNGSNGLVEFGSILGTDQLNEMELDWSYYGGSGPWLNYGEDWHPAMSAVPTTRSFNISLASPLDNTNVSSPISFVYNVSVGWSGQEIRYCNLTATSDILRTSEISPVNENGLVGLWHFNGDLLDSSGNGNDGEAINDASISSDGKFGSGAEILDGADDYVNISDSDSLDSTDLTVSAWIKYSGSDEGIIWNRIISKKTAWTDNDGFEITMVSESDSEIYAAGSGDMPNVRINCVDSWSDNEWHHVVAVYQGASVDIYCDGSFKGSGEINPIVANDRPLFFGGMQDQYFNGKIDEVAIWNRSLSADEVSGLYSVSYKNSSALITKDLNQILSLDLANGNYTWSISCTDDAGLIGTSETRSLTVSGGITHDENQTVNITTASGYSPQIYYSDSSLPTSGNNFNLRYNDKIKFVAHARNHTLTLGGFNSTTARVLIQSSPITAYLQKGTIYEFDLNNDSTKEVRVRYDGMNGNRAKMFIQEIVSAGNAIVDNKSAVGELRDDDVVQDMQRFSWKLVVSIVLVLIALIIALYFRHKKKGRFAHAVRYYDSPLHKR